MKRRRIFSIAAALGLMTGIIPAATTMAATPAVQTVTVTFISTECPSWTVVPANKTPLNFDQTGGHAAQLDTSYQTLLVDPTTDIPGVCRRTDGWAINIYADAGLSTLLGTATTGSDGVGTGSATVVLDPTELADAQATGTLGDGLWLAETLQPSVAGFGALRCFNDMNNGDDQENIQGVGNANLQIYCISYNVLDPGTFHPLTPPVRLLDTRVGKGLSGKLVANTPATFPVTLQGRSDTPVPANATAVTGNLTVTGPSSSYAIYLGPSPIAHPGSSTMNFNAGETTANGVTVALGAGGTLSATYLANAGNTTDLVFDVTGYFTPDMTGGTYHAIAPDRLLDTRINNGLSGKLVANTPATFFVSAASRPGSPVPANATAVTGNLTVTDQTSSWAIYIGPVANPTPTTSTLNFEVGDVKANNLTVTLGAGGTLSTTYLSNPGNTTDLVFDVTGYYTPDATGSRFVPVDPARLLDTRIGNGYGTKLTSNSPATFQVSGRGDVDTAATGVTGNLTVVNETNSWAIFLGPAPEGSPTTSTLNFNVGDVRANGVTLQLGAGGALSATYISSGGQTTDLVFDVTGYFVP